ncbi:MAG: hypothetical protein IPJ43_02640 [Saprospiraceae bacterium]|nr:hypothetical protein [Saprospiraceae bacterium]
MNGTNLQLKNGDNLLFQKGDSFSLNKIDQLLENTELKNTKVKLNEAVEFVDHPISQNGVHTITSNIGNVTKTILQNKEKEFIK